MIGGKRKREVDSMNPAPSKNSGILTMKNEGNRCGINLDLNRKEGAG